MLDKLKHLREVNFYEGTSMASHIYEEKVDGWRMLGYKDGERVRLVSRNGRDHTRRFGNITAAIAKLSARSLMLDGEVVTYDQQLRSASTGCANRSPNAVASPPLPMAFVLLYQDRRDLTGRALRDRRARLEVTWPAAN